MGLMVHSLENIPESAKRDYFIYLLDYGWDEPISDKHGQIAHLDQNSSNTDEDNLAFMCMPHHSEYDSKTSQHKNFTEGELKELRSRLYKAIESGYHHPVKNITPKDVTFSPKVDEIQQLVSEASDKNVPVSNLLRKAKSIAKKRNDTTMLDWIDKELNGYSEVLVKDLPSYRKIHGDAYTYNYYRGWERVQFHSDAQKRSYTHAPNGESIATIEAQIAGQSDSGVFIFNNANAERAIRKALQNPRSVNEVQIRISSSSLHNILDAVRNYIHEWALASAN